MSNELLYPPMMLTDLPVSDRPDVNGRQPPGGSAAITMCRIPKGFQDTDLAGGLAMAYIASGYGGGFLLGGPSLHVGLHAPVTQPGEYQHGWESDVTDIGLNPGIGNFGEGQVDCVLGAQRYGDKIYAIAGGSTEPTNNARIWWFNFKEFAVLTYARSLYLADAIPYVPSSFGSNATLHVSDEATARLWFLNNDQMLFFPDTSQDLGTYTFINDYFSNFDQVYLGINPSAGLHYYGRGMDGFMKVDRETADGYGPALVFPWSSGDYGTPELWYFMFERDPNTGMLTQRLNIYRSQWKPGLNKLYNIPRTNFTYGQSDAVFYHAPYNEAGDSSSLYSGEGYGTNPGAYGFEKSRSWYNTAHYVGTVGPFPNLYFADPQGHTTLPSGVYAANPLRIDVHRDPRRRNKLELVLSHRSNTAPYRNPSNGFNQRLNGVWNSIFTCTSGDDGKTWNAGRQISPPVHLVQMEGSESLTFFPESGTNLSFKYPSVILDTGDLAIAHQASHVIGTAGDQYIALSLPDFQGYGEADASRKGQVYKRGDLKRLSWV